MNDSERLAAIREWWSPAKKGELRTLYTEAQWVRTALDDIPYLLALIDRMTPVVEAVAEMRGGELGHAFGPKSANLAAKYDAYIAAKTA